MTLETRGFGIRGARTTSYVEVRFTTGDAVVCLVLALILIGAILAAIFLGK